MKIYLETSVPNFLFTKDAPEKRVITENFFKIDIKKHEPYVSDLVIDEFNMAPEEIKKELKNIIPKYKLGLLKVSDECKKLADKYLKAGLIPEKYRNDALHVAVAVVNRMDVLISWNMQHIVKLKTVVGVNKINKESGYKEILIYTPEEVIE